MRSYRLTPRALQDLDNIADYTREKWGARQVDLYLTTLAKRFAWLAESPNAGRNRDDVGQGYRSYREGLHLIFYVVQRDNIAIIGVPHASMDIETYFQSPI